MKTDLLPSQRTSRHVLNVIVRDPLALLSTLVIVAFFLLAVFAPLVAPHPEQGQGRANADDTILAPTGKYLLGTDRLGRDILSRVIFGARPALVVPMGVVLFAVIIGAPLGALAGYKGGWVDEVIMRATDLFLPFPSLLLAMAITASIGRGLAFIGLGTQPPAPDWGLMISEGRTFILNQWWIAAFPGIAIFIVVLAFNLLGDTLRDMFDPRQYK